ncbi:TIM-barrel domain-containing protein [uncultured Jatrophihabitans sp.]|uniref:TIM-barrel domain-containing protein n=1 Tax=uncultured Jatrophihabitans sp. TaxID=1610747 RepID=UPI0035CC8322
MKTRRPVRARRLLAAVAVATLCAGVAAAVTTPSASGATPASAAGRAVVSGDARFEVLSPTLIRTEYAGDKHFLNAGTFNVVGRNAFPRTRFVSKVSGGWLRIDTDAVSLRYKVGSGPFTSKNLLVSVDDGGHRVTAAPWAQSAPKTCAAGVRCEAEDLTLSGLKLATDHTGSSGRGFVAGFEQTGNSLTFTTTIAAAGTYDIAARYANYQGGDGKIETRTLSVSADGGTPTTLSLPPTADWDTWQVARASLALSAGTHTVTISRAATDSGDVNVDNVAVLTQGADYPGVAAPTVTPCAFGTVCEAESGALQGGAKLASDHNNYSGDGFVGGLEKAGAADQLSVTGVPRTGRYALQLRYANSAAGAQAVQSRTMTVAVGSAKPTTVTLAPTSSWDAWRTISVPVQITKGTDSVTLGCPTDDSCNVNVDTVAAARVGSPVLDPHAALGGYRRSMDQVDGSAPTNPGLLYQDGWSLIDDTPSAVYDTRTRTVTQRPTHDGKPYQDGYVFGYGKDYAQALQDLSTLSGPAKLLPRWAYGTWYSEYYDRTAADYENTILPKFRSEGVPLDVLVTDTDFKVPNQWNGWEIDPSKFPDPKAYFAWAHAQGLHTALNLHPSIEESDPQFAKAQQIAKGKLKPGACGGGATNCYVFDFGDPDQLKAYLALHDQMQADGNDLWWMDWCCDGSTSSLPGVTGDAWVNQAYADYTDKTVDRGFAFSRAYGTLEDGGYGNATPVPTGPWADKRTTLHFTGDTISDWQTLAYEVGYTPGESAATGLPSISHDIGGHTGGTQTTGSEPGSTKLSDDLYARWVQFGTFQPIDRLHSNHSDRLPWQYGTDAKNSAEKFLNLREKLMPYTYTLAQQARATGMPITRALYLQYPEQQEAYAQADSEYLYGPDMLVAPVTTPGTTTTTSVWFPAGSSWTDWFTGKTYRGGTTAKITTGLGSMPVFVRSGGIVTTRTKDVSNDVQNTLTAASVTVAQGAKGSSTLYEDDGTSTSPRHATTRIALKGNAVTVAPTVGSFRGQPATRTWAVNFTNAHAPTTVSIDGRKVSAKYWTWHRSTDTLTVRAPARSVRDQLRVSYR